jgi:hypothetical protein
MPLNLMVARSGHAVTAENAAHGAGKSRPSMWSKPSILTRVYRRTVIVPARCLIPDSYPRFPILPNAASTAENQPRRAEACLKVGHSHSKNAAFHW